MTMVLLRSFLWSVFFVAIRFGLGCLERRLDHPLITGIGFLAFFAMMVALSWFFSELFVASWQVMTS